MSTYIIGDVHGCYQELRLLLDLVNFNLLHDKLLLTGDIALRGQSTLDVLRFLYSIRKNIILVLGNNDLHLIKMYLGMQKIYPSDQVSNLFNAPDIHILMQWLQKKSFIHIDHIKRIIVVHAGIPFFWTIKDVIKYNLLINQFFNNSVNFIKFLSDSIYYDSKINYFNYKLSEKYLIYYCINALTRMRYCYLNGDLDFFCKNNKDAKILGVVPWFSINSTVVKENYTIFFGHWSAIKGKGTPKNIFGLDTGCCWGGGLTMIRWEDKIKFFQKKISY